jgi:protein-L-isoaspartate O-methyltransferase
MRQLSYLITRSPFLVLPICLLLNILSVTEQARAGMESPHQGTKGTVQPSQSAQPGRINRATSEPYKGKLSIFEDPKRAQRLQIERVMDILGIQEGAGVADIGAGSGWFTVRAARRAGVTGTVYAVEINQRFLEHIRARAASEGLTNIRTVLGKDDNPLLPVQSLDAVLILKAYHEIAQPVLLLTHLREAMRPAALLGIIDKNGKGDDHGIERATVIKEAQQSGFALVETYDFVKPDGMDYFLVFRLRPAYQ